MQLFYREYGQGRPLIVLHGLFGVSDNWVGIAKRIAALGFHVFVLDQRNHGQSPHSETFNYAALSDDLKLFALEHGLKDPMLLGHSMGGKVAMNFALENPSMVSKLIIVDIALRSYALSQNNKDILDVMRTVDLSQITSRDEVMAILEAHIPNHKVRLLALKNLQRVGKNQFQWRVDIDNIYKNLQDLSSDLALDRTFEKEVLFIKGSKSDYINDADTSDINQVFTSNTICVIKDASHWVQADQPELFLECVGKFITTE